MVAIILISALAFVLFQARKQIHALLAINEARLEILLARADALGELHGRVVVLDGPESEESWRRGIHLLNVLPPLDRQITVVSSATADGSTAVDLAHVIGLPPSAIRSTDGRFVIRAGRLLVVRSDGRVVIVAVAPLTALVSGLWERLSMDLFAVGFLGFLLFLVRESRLSDYSIRRLLDASPIPLVLMDVENGVLRFANRAAFDLFPERRLRAFEELQAALQQCSEVLHWLIGDEGSGDEIATREFEIRCAEGQSRWVIVSRHRLIVQGRRQLIASIADITVRHEAEVALKRAKEQAEALGRMRSESLAMISHELRTPVTGVLGLAQLLAAQPLAAPAARIVRRMVQAGRTLAAIINDFVDVAMLEVGQVRLDQRVFDPQETVAAAVSLASAGAARGLAIHVRCENSLPALLGDPDRLQQIVINLVGNAIKFTEKGHVAIDVTTTRRSREAVELAIDVNDTGIGIPADVIPRLFQPFSQGETGSKRRYGGTGLGLAICKRLAEAMGGSITVDSELNKGSTFRVRLPFEHAVETVIAPGERSRARVLVVDDVTLNRDVVADLLRAEGCEAETAASGREAVEQVTTGRFDVVLMDIRMPDMDGLAATAAIRARAAAARLPILGLTANPLPTNRALYRLRGIDDIIEKPIDRLKLKQAIDGVKMPSAPAIVGNVPSRIEHLIRSLGRERTGRIVAAFTTVGGEAIETIAESCAALDFDQVAEAAHRLSGAASNLGMEDLALATARLEGAARAGLASQVSRAAETAVIRFMEVAPIVNTLIAGSTDFTEAQSESM